MKYIFLLLIIIRAICYRIRGSAHPYPANLNAYPNPALSTTDARVLFHVIPDFFTIAMLCFFTGQPLWLAFISAALSYGTICIGQASYQGNTIIAYLWMTALLTLRISAIYAPIAVYALNWHYILPVALSLLVFPACWLSYEKFMQKNLNLKIWKLIIPLIYTPNSSEPEELLIGGIIGLVSATEFICMLS